MSDGSVQRDDGTPQAAAPSTAAAPAAGAARRAESWTISTASVGTKRKISKKEREAIDKSQRQEGSVGSGTPSAQDSSAVDGDNGGATSSSPSAAVAVNLNDVPVDPAVLIPTNLETTRSDLLQRTHLDVPRLLCICKQYPRSCGVTSLTSVWNLLYSRIGYGTLPPVSQEEVLAILGFRPPFDNIRFGCFTGNTTLLRWFHSINRAKGVRGKAYYLWKVHGHGRTPGVTADAAQGMLCDALRSPSSAVIYHCHNHYMVPIGFQRIPRLQRDCYRPSVPDDDTEMTVFIGEVSRGRHPAMYAVKWNDIARDLNTILPEYVNIRRAELGVQVRGSAKSSLASSNGPPDGQNRNIGAASSSTTTFSSSSSGVPPPSDATTTTSFVTGADNVLTGNGGEGGAEQQKLPPLPPPPAKARKVMNLHCLLIFRSDMVEDDLAQFEEAADPEAEGGHNSEDDGVM